MLSSVAVCSAGSVTVSVCELADEVARRVERARAEQRIGRARGGVPQVELARRGRRRRRPATAAATSGETTYRRDRAAAPAPAATAAHACARSPLRIRSETPSTTQWWTSTSTRPGRRRPASSQTTCTIRPASGSRRAAATAVSAAIASRSGRSPRLDHGHDVGGRARAPGAGTSSAQPASRRRRARSRSWRSSSACTTRSSRSRSSPPGACSSSDWWKPPIDPPSSRSQCMIGVGATRPEPVVGRPDRGVARRRARAGRDGRQPGDRALLEDVARAHDEPGLRGRG